MALKLRPKVGALIDQYENCCISPREEEGGKKPPTIMAWSSG